MIEDKDNTKKNPNFYSSFIGNYKNVLEEWKKTIDELQRCLEREKKSYGLMNEQKILYESLLEIERKKINPFNFGTGLVVGGLFFFLFGLVSSGLYAEKRVQNAVMCQQPKSVYIRQIEKDPRNFLDIELKNNRHILFVEEEKGKYVPLGPVQEEKLNLEREKIQDLEKKLLEDKK